ncbi:MAG: hypothetical protein EXS32_17375 [Opitutus sp.]|nr:hypothetical protein [Opitutus sp.]
MTSTLLHYWGNTLAVAGPMVAQVSSRLFDKVGVASAILLTMAGLVLRAYLPRLQMSSEERMKDGNMTDAEARRQQKFYSRCANVASLVGVAVLVVVLFELTS